MLIADRHIAQGSLDWVRTRLGCLTASRVNQLISSVKPVSFYGDCGTRHSRPELAEKCKKCTSAVERTATDVSLSQQRHNLLYRLAAEWATGEPADDFGGVYWTERGEALESSARAYFELQTDLQVETVPFIWRDSGKLTGCSPDGLVVDILGDPVGGLELKCPAAATHIQYMLANMDGEPIAYDYQVQFSLWVTGLPRWWFMSYFPGLPPVLVEIEPDPMWQAAFDEHIPPFIERLQEAKRRLMESGVDKALEAA